MACSEARVRSTWIEIGALNLNATSSYDPRSLPDGVCGVTKSDTRRLEVDVAFCVADLRQAFGRVGFDIVISNCSSVPVRSSTASSGTPVRASDRADLRRGQTADS